MPGQTAHKILFAIAQFIAPKVGVTEGHKNLATNIAEEEKLVRTLITDQSKLSAMRYGDSNVGNTGCEAVAIFNILAMKGRPRRLSDIIRDLEERQTLVNRGRWGTNPFMLDTLLQEYNLDYEIMETLEEAEEKMSVGDIFFITVWNDGRNPFRGIHGYVIRLINDEKTGEPVYGVFNRVYQDYPERTKSLKEAVDRGSYIVGYLIR